MIWFTAALIAGAVATTRPADSAPSYRLPPSVGRSVHELLNAPDRHVRAVSTLAQQLLTEGMKRSRTFEAIVEALEATDLIVHVEVNTKLPASVAGRLMFGSAPPNGPRYVRVQIAEFGTRLDQIASIGHELQHALEVSEAPEVRCTKTFRKLYERIGAPSLPTAYDTEAAQRVGQKVLLELVR
jgi:hypothetical protein